MPAAPPRLPGGGPAARDDTVVQNGRRADLYSDRAALGITPNSRLETECEPETRIRTGN